MIRKLNHHLKERGLSGTIARLKQCYDDNGFSYTVRQMFAAPKPTRELLPNTLPAPVAKPDIHQLAKQYLADSEAQSNYLKLYGKQPIKHRITSLVNLIKLERNYKGIVLYPVTYDINVKQRPEHILRVLADEGYLCLMLKVGADHSSSVIRKLGKRLYFTDLYEESVAYFEEKQVFLYITAPFFCYLPDHFQKAFVIYDVLDDLKIFSNYSAPMEADHRELVRQANVVIYSSKVMEPGLADAKGNLLLLENGVWPADFQFIESKNARRNLKGTRGTKVGYHGVISELLNFDILESILKTDTDLYLIGPIIAFDSDKQDELNERITELKKYRNLHLLGFTPYDQLPSYLHYFDYSIIPFIINEQTDAVSPIKLFESLAMSKPVLATATKTLLGYRDIINILSPEEFADFVAEGRGRTIDKVKYDAILESNSWDALVAPLANLMSATQGQHFGLRPKVKAAPPKIDIINVNFFDWNGDVLYKGGAERYVYDLAKIGLNLGCQVQILQNANFYFTKEFNGVQVVGVPSKFQNSLPKLSEYYNSFCSKADLIVASPLDLACELNPAQKIIGINHGIYWDAKENTLQNYSVDRYQPIFNAVKNSDVAVCVDTNFINWLRTYDWNLAQKCEYIPNYVDTEQFQATRKNFDEELTVLYPRRLYEARGLYIVIDAFSHLLTKYPWLKLDFVGQADEKDAIQTRKFANRFPDQVNWYELAMEDMHLAYQKSHIALVPTMYAEGTSLSCIEAMATNNAVISTTIGGLPNLIHNKHNGILIRPDAEDLIKSVEFLIQDRQALATIAKNGIASAAAFNKNEWIQSWDQVFSSNLSITGSRLVARVNQYEKEFS